MGVLACQPWLVLCHFGQVRWTTTTGFVAPLMPKLAVYHFTILGKWYIHLAARAVVVFSLLCAKWRSICMLYIEVNYEMCYNSTTHGYFKDY